MRTPLPPAPHVLAFAAAVDAATSRVPAVTRAEAHHTAHCYSVRYTVNNGPLIALEDAPTASEAVAQFVAAATYDAHHGPVLALRTPSTDEYLPPLHPSVSEMLLTAAERGTCRVFPLAGWRTDDAGNQQPRWAVCQPCPREQWHDLERGELLVYTELYTFPEGWDEDVPGATALVTHVGELLAYDGRRGLFYATAWNVGEESRHLAADDVQEVWRVVRLIPMNRD